MTIPRFYVPGPWTSDRITFPEKASHHAMRVLRMRNGDEAEVFDGEGRTARGRTEFSSEGTVLIAESYPEHGRESPLFITLAQAFVSPDKMEWITEKAVEAGAPGLCFSRPPGQSRNFRAISSRSVLRNSAPPRSLPASSAAGAGFLK